MVIKLKASLRESRRYILLEGKKESIEKAILDYVGILGWGKAVPIWVKNGVLSVLRSEITNILGAFAIYEDKIKVLKVSGTLKGLR